MYKKQEEINEYVCDHICYYLKSTTDPEELEYHCEMCKVDELTCQLIREVKDNGKEQ